MTTTSGHELRNGDMLEMRTNVGASPRYFLNDKEITVGEYWQYINSDLYDKNLEVMKESQKTFWHIFTGMLRMFK